MLVLVGLAVAGMKVAVGGGGRVAEGARVAVGSGVLVGGTAVGVALGFRAASTVIWATAVSTAWVWMTATVAATTAGSMVGVACGAPMPQPLRRAATPTRVRIS